MRAADIARVVHEANRAIQAINGDPVNSRWDDLADDLKFSTYDGVRAAQAGASPEQLHENWMAERIATGWTHHAYEKDERRKRHPQLVPYDQLPEAQRAKDKLFYAIVAALSD